MKVNFEFVLAVSVFLIVVNLVALSILASMFYLFDVSINIQTMTLGIVVVCANALVLFRLKEIFL